MKKLLFLLVPVLCLAMLGGCGGRAHSYQIYETFDTVIEVITYTSAADAQKYGEMARQELLKWHRLSDAYHPFADTVGVYQINHTTQKCEVSDELADLLCFGVEAAAATDGTVNPMCGAVTGLWKNTEVPPDTDALAAAGKHTDIASLHIEGNTVWRSDAAALLDLGAFAKGYALDQTAKVLKNAGFCGIISATSSIITVGNKNGTPFRVAIAGVNGGTAATLSLEDMALATSGKNQRYFMYEGHRYHHIIDLATGAPAESGVEQASVIAPSAAWADVYSTAALIDGASKQDAVLCRNDGTVRFCNNAKEWTK